MEHQVHISKGRQYSYTMSLLHLCCGCSTSEVSSQALPCRLGVLFRFPALTTSFQITNHFNTKMKTAYLNWQAQQVSLFPKETR